MYTIVYFGVTKTHKKIKKQKFVINKTKHRKNSGKDIQTM